LPGMLPGMLPGVLLVASLQARSLSGMQNGPLAPPAGATSMLTAPASSGFTTSTMIYPVISSIE
jgi:hypothetical protein